MEPVNDIWNREIPSELKSILVRFAAMIEEFVNMGTQILGWDMKPTDPGDHNVAHWMLFRHFLDTLDSISILVSAGSGDVSKSLMRNLFESYLGVAYIFEKDSKKRGLRHIVTGIHKQIREAKVHDPHSGPGKEFAALAKKEKVLENTKLTDDQLEELYEFIREKEEFVKSPTLREANKEYLARHNIRKNPNWYHLGDGPQDIQHLADYLGMKMYYKVFYNKWSGMVHSSDLIPGRIVNTSNDSVGIYQIRFYGDIEEVFNNAILLARKVFRIYLTARCPDKLENMAKWLLTVHPELTELTKKKWISVVPPNDTNG